MHPIDTDKKRAVDLPLAVTATLIPRARHWHRRHKERAGTCHRKSYTSLQDY